MQTASEATVLGHFDGGTFSKDGVESVFFKRDGKFWVRTDGPDGRLTDFEIAYTFGIAPLQQYLIQLPGGRIQALGIAWDARPASEGGQRWYHLYPDRKLAAGDPLHWTGIDQNWNYQCAWCHSTNLQKNYDPASGGFKTTWSEINVGCEACHGPAANHIAWATGPRDAASGKRGFDRLFHERDQAVRSTDQSGQPLRASPRAKSTEIKSKEIRVCAGCHARRQQFSDKPADVATFFDAFRPSLLEPGLYHADGQQREEDYNYASFLQSKMHGAGVTCSDCHNPHSGRLKLPGNAVCAQCHAPERYEQTSHHHHASASKGALCVNCHMPTATYMGVHARQDHSIRIPRPDRTLTLGTPNACNQCHEDKNAAWAVEAIASWRLPPTSGAQSFAEVFARADLDAPGSRPALMRFARDAAHPGIVRASALARLARAPGAEERELAARLLTIDDPSVRMAAIAVLAGDDASMRRLRLAPLLRDETRLVRMDAARALAGEAERGLPAEDRMAFEAALNEYVAAQLFNAERPEAHANLGGLYLERGKLDEARAAYARAIELDPTFHPAVIALAELTRANGDEGGAEAMLQKALKANPTSGALAHALGLSLVRRKRVAEAMEKLAEAAKLEPDEPRFAFVLAVALHDTGKNPQAIDILKGAVVRRPYDRDALMVLTSYEIEAGRFSSALSRAELLAKLEPGSDRIRRLLTAARILAR
jgi:Flp pilus assembly protein TadD